MTELKNCPFCGGNDVGGAMGAISCYSCDAELESNPPRSTVEIVKLWNTRAELSQPWISFKDRLPPVDTYILVRSISGNFLATMADKDEGHDELKGFTDWQLIVYPSPIPTNTPVED